MLQVIWHSISRHDAEGSGYLSLLLACSMCAERGGVTLDEAAR
jgi:hypothetical protein